MTATIGSVARKLINNLKIVYWIAPLFQLIWVHLLAVIATTSGKAIVVYNSLFYPNSSIERILAHELTHVLIENEWKNKINDYSKYLGWQKLKTRPGNFVDADGEESEEEDFANNLEFYLFEPKTLEKITSKASEWFKKHLGSDLNLQKGCEHEKK